MSAWQYAVLNLTAAACLGIAIFGLVVQRQADSLQQDVAKRKQVIERGVELSRVNTSLIQALAAEALSSGDSDLGRILTDQGIRFSATASGGDDG